MLFCPARLLAEVPVAIDGAISFQIGNQNLHRTFEWIPRRGSATTLSWRHTFRVWVGRLGYNLLVSLQLQIAQSGIESFHDCTVFELS